MICGMPEVFKDVVFGNRTGPAKIFYKGRRKMKKPFFCVKRRNAG